MKKQTVIIIVAIGLLAALWYFFIYKKTAAATSTIAPLDTTAPDPVLAVINAGSPAPLATQTAPSQTLVTAPAVITGISAQANPTTTAINPAQFDAIILPWMNSLGINNKTRALAIYPTMTQTEKAGLADIIQNVWGGKRAQTSGDTEFWNEWRMKYHVLDGTYSPFTGGTNSLTDAQQAYEGRNDFENPQDAYVPHNISPLSPTQNSQTANNFVQRGSGQQAYNSAKGNRKAKATTKKKR